MELTINSEPVVELASNTFEHVPIVLQYENIPLIEVIQDQPIGFETQIPIYHPDGTYLAKVKGNRIFETPDGKKANIKVRDLQDAYVCYLDGKVIFELKHGTGDSFKADAELFAPEGYFVKCADGLDLKQLGLGGSELTLGTITIKGCTFGHCPVGIWIGRDRFSVGGLPGRF